MREDVWVCLFGVADPAGTGGCEDGLLRRIQCRAVERVALSESLMRRCLEDFFGAHHETGFAHGICVYNPGKAITILASYSKAAGSA